MTHHMRRSDTTTDNETCQHRIDNHEASTECRDSTRIIVEHGLWRCNICGASDLLDGGAC